MLIDFFREYKDYVYGTLTFIVSIIAIVMRAKFVPRDEHKSLEEKFGVLVEAHATLKGRVDRTEDRVSELPKAKDIQELVLQLAAVKGSLDVNAGRSSHLGDQIKRLQMQVDRMEDFLNARRA